jgi:aminopeptidase-like protein
MSQLPIKFRMVQAICLNEEVSNQEILELLKKEYPLDRSITEEGVEDYLLSLKAVGLIKLTSVSTANNGKLKMFYQITHYGRSRMKYV